MGERTAYLTGSRDPSLGQTEPQAQPLQGIPQHWRQWLKEQRTALFLPAMGDYQAPYIHSSVYPCQSLFSSHMVWASAPWAKWGGDERVYYADHWRVAVVIAVLPAMAWALHAPVAATVAWLWVWVQVLLWLEDRQYYILEGMGQVEHEPWVPDCWPQGPGTAAVRKWEACPSAIADKDRACTLLTPTPLKQQHLEFRECKPN